MNIQLCAISRIIINGQRKSFIFDAEGQKEGMVKVVGISPVETVAESIGLLLDAKIELASGSYHFIKNRIVHNKELILCSMDVTFLAETPEEEKMTANKAKVFLLPEEIPCFSLALWQHPIPFPTNISQVQTVDHGITCIQLETKEPPEDFAKRLSSALKAIAGPSTGRKFEAFIQ